MNYFSETYGLVTRNDPATENGGLFFAHYLVLKKMLGYEADSFDNQIFISKMKKAFVIYGLYLRSEKHTERTVSQDEQTGFFVASYLLKTHHKNTIWNYLFKHIGNYPATGARKFYNPGSYYSWAVLAQSKISFILAPWYTINLLISSNKGKQDTSSKLIYLTELFCMRDESTYCDFLWQYFEWRMEVMYGHSWVKSLYDIYFSGEELNHPLRELSNKLQQRN